MRVSSFFTEVNAMIEVRYVCEGGCGGMVTEEEFKAGKNKCGAPDCPNHEKPFVRKGYCTQCKATFPEGTEHTCANI